MGSFCVLLTQFSIIRQTETPDMDVIQKKIAVGNGVIFVAFDDFDQGTGGTNHNSNVIGPSGIVVQIKGIIPVVINIISGQGIVVVIFCPPVNGLPKLDLPFTAAFGGDKT